MIVSVTRDEFARWREDRITRWVMAAHAKVAEDAKEAWISASWNGGNANPLLLKELRVTADSYEAILATDYEAYCETLGLIPEPLPMEEAA